MTAFKISSQPQNECDLAITRLQEGTYHVVRIGLGASLYLMLDDKQVEFSSLKIGDKVEVPSHVNGYWHGISDCTVEGQSQEAKA